MAVIISAIRKSTKSNVCPISMENKEKHSPCFTEVDSLLATSFPFTWMHVGKINLNFSCFLLPLQCPDLFTAPCSIPQCWFSECCKKDSGLSSCCAVPSDPQPSETLFSKSAWSKSISGESWFTLVCHFCIALTMISVSL